jgi:hypothetical protein
MKKCNCCAIEKNHQEFYGGSQETVCRSCISINRKAKYRLEREKVLLRVKKYRTENPEKIRDTKLRQADGVGVAYFEEKLKEQNGVCGCCKKNRKTLWRGKEVRMALDHDHETGKPRGILCIKCNRALGLLEEKQETILSLLEYIRKYQN